MPLRMKSHKGQFQKGSDRAREEGRRGGAMGNPSSKGFAGMSPEQHKAISSKGGKTTWERKLNNNRPPIEAKRAELVEKLDNV